MSPRLFLDISTTCRWTGTPVGIVRVERALARWARLNRPDIAFVFFDTRTNCYHHVEEAWIDALLDGSAYLDSWPLPEASATHIRFVDRFPAPLNLPARFLLRFRRQLLMSLETRRLQSGDPGKPTVTDFLQRRLMSGKYAQLMLRADGTRRPVLPPDFVIADKAEFGSGDILVNAGSGWSHIRIEAVAELKRRYGFSFFVMIYDIIPLMFPQFYSPRDVAMFEAYMEKALPTADRLIFGSHRICADVLTYCRERGLPVGQTRVVPYGAEAPPRRDTSAAALPAGLQPGRYILLVSTIEPRKGHGFLLGVWRRLLEAGIPQAADFKLVFVGREGWMIGDVKEQLEAMKAEEYRVGVQAGVDDATLALLYEHAAFCVYPSEYEGFGLPLIEAFGHGKAVIASDRGSIPEVVGEFSPCLAPDDADAWFEILSRWITDPAVRSRYETAIRERFRPMTWDQAARIFFDSLLIDTPEANAKSVTPAAAAPETP